MADQSNQNYIDGCLKSGKFVEIASPRLKPLESPQRLKARHLDLEHGAMIACQLASTTDALTVPVVDTEDRLMIVQIEPQQLPLQDTTMRSAYEKQINMAQIVKDRNANYLNCISKLNSGVFRTYSDFREACGGDEEVKEVLTTVRKFKGSSTSVQTIDGVVEVNLDKIRRSTLPGDSVAHVSTTVSGTKTHRGEVWVDLFLDKKCLLSVLPRPESAISEVCLQAANNLRTIKILQALAFLDKEAEVVIGSALELTTNKWRLTMNGFVNEDLVITSLGALAHLIPH